MQFSTVFAKYKYIKSFLNRENLMKKIIEILKAIIAKLCKPVQVEVKISSEKVEEVQTPETTDKVEKVSKDEKPATLEKSAKRRGRPRKVKAE